MEGLEAKKVGTLEKTNRLFYLRDIYLIGYFIYWQTWNQSMRGANSLTWGHVVIRRAIVNPQSIRLHFCYLQFHSGEMRAPFFAHALFIDW